MKKSFTMLGVVLAASTMGGCGKKPTSTIEHGFAAQGLAFEVNTFESSGPAANHHTVYVRGLGSSDREELIFNGRGGDTPIIRHDRGNRFIISYEGGLWYEVWAEKHIEVEGANGPRPKIVFFAVAQ